MKNKLIAISLSFCVLWTEAVQAAAPATEFRSVSVAPSSQDLLQEQALVNLGDVFQRIPISRRESWQWLAAAGMVARFLKRGIDRQTESISARQPQPNPHQGTNPGSIGVPLGAMAVWENSPGHERPTPPLKREPPPVYEHEPSKNPTIAKRLWESARSKMLDYVFDIRNLSHPMSPHKQLKYTLHLVGPFPYFVVIISAIFFQFSPIGGGIMVAVAVASLSFYNVVERNEEIYKRRIDLLTGVPNRNALEIYDDQGRFNEKGFLPSLLKHTTGMNTPMAMIMVDADNFKRINDLYGHPKGDEVLQKLAGAIRGTIRATDFIHRIGGEEFLLLLPNTSEEQAAHVATRILEAIHEIEVQIPDLDNPGVTLPYSVKASLGIAVTERENLSEGLLHQRVNQYIALADHALIEAKKTGKDRFVTAPPLSVALKDPAYAFSAEESLNRHVPDVLDRLRDMARRLLLPLRATLGETRWETWGHGLSMGAIPLLIPLVMDAILAPLAGIISVFPAYRIIVDVRHRRAIRREIYDAVTGLPTRNILGLDSEKGFLPLLFDRAVNRNEKLTAIFLDLDYFKTVNDVYGHRAGDQVLREVAALIRQFIPPTDRVIRYGGEEFLILLKDVDVNTAAEMARAIRQKLENHLIHLDGAVITMRASFGVAEASPLWSPDAPLLGQVGAWLNAADQALLHAKEDGRNSVHVTQTPEESNSSQIVVGSVEPEGRQIEIYQLLKDDVKTTFFRLNDLNRKVAAMFDESVKQAKPLTAVFLNVDHLKAVNDRYGHRPGDKVLAATARIARESIKAEDECFRYQGDTFLLLIHGDVVEATTAARKIQQKLKETAMKIDDEEPFYVTASYGIAVASKEWRPEGTAEDQSDAWFFAADRAMYQAKRRRDHIEIATPDHEFRADLERFGPPVSSPAAIQHTKVVEEAA